LVSTGGEVIFPVQALKTFFSNSMNGREQSVLMMDEQRLTAQITEDL